jgi:iron(III) transport system ATP-binding protein
MKSIRINTISKVYPGTDAPAVDAVSLDIPAGEFFFLLGPSGCGKTTLLRMIAGLTTPTSGSIHLGERDVTDLPAEKRNTALVFQNYALWPHMTVQQNVAFGPKMRKVPRPQRRSRVDRVLSLVQMGDYARRRPAQLSGGQQQRVALARALAASPDCLLMDEPLSNLDAKLRLEMRSQLRTLVKDTGATAVYVTHDQKEALSMADRIAVMHEGRIQQLGTPQEVYRRPATRFVADFLGEGNFIDGTVAEVSDQLVIDTPAGRLLAEVDERFCSGMELICCLRPEGIRLSGPEEQGPQLTATVVESVFLGEIAQVTFRLADGQLWKVNLMGTAALAVPAPGQQATLAIDPTQVVLLTQ